MVESKSDLNCAERMHLDDDETQTAFIKENLRTITRKIYRIVRDVEIAKDLTQESFIKALESGYQLRDAKKSSAWISRIACNHALDYLRRRRTAMKSIALKNSLDRLPESNLNSREESTEDRLIRAETRTMLDGGLALLTEREKTAIILRDVEGIPAVEVAQILNCNPATVRTHISKARIKFRKYLETYQPQSAT